MADNFLNALQQAFPDLKVEHYPDDPENYQLGSAKSVILVTFHDRKFELPDGSDGSGQKNSPVFQVTYISRSLLTKKKIKGAYDLLDSGRTKLKEVTNLNIPAAIAREFYINTKPGGVWIHAQLWVLTDYFD